MAIFFLSNTFMNLKNLKIKLPKTWKESSRSCKENQFFIWINHISPLTNIDSKKFQTQQLPSSDTNVPVIRLGIPTASRAPLKDFYDGMKASISSGLLPPEINHQWLEKLWKGMTKTPGFEYPGESDLSVDISIAKYQDEEVAEQSFKNIALMPTKGFDVPIPGGSQVPGISKDVTITELLKSDVYEKYMSKEYLKKYMSKDQLKEFEKHMSKDKLEEMKSAIKEVQKEMPKVERDMSKSGVKYREGRYLGCKAIYIEGKNPMPKSKPRLSSRKKGNFPAGSVCDIFDPLPKVSLPCQKTIISYQAILIKNFIIIGSFLWMVASLPPGNTPCYSLTRSKKKVIIDNDGDKTIYIVPLVSNYGKEGYIHREEAEGIIKNIIAPLSGLK